jgi:hypothetical protein
MLPLRLQLFGAVTLSLFLGWVIYLIRHRRLTLSESLTWFLSTAAALVMVLFPQTLVWSARVLSIEVPSNALFALAYLYLLGNLLSLTIGLSGQTARLRRVTQECALLRAEIEQLRAETTGTGELRKQEP